MAVTYAAAAAIWIAATDRIETGLALPQGVHAIVNTGKGFLFVLVTAGMLYMLVVRFLGRAYEDRRRYREAQESLRNREQSILQAYIDVLDAVTGGKLILMWPEELEASLGEVVVPATPIGDPSRLSDARHAITSAIGGNTDDIDEVCLGISEGLTNALKHGIRGEYEIRFTADKVQAVIIDRGPGIDFHSLPKATLVPGFSTKPSLGMGFTIMLDVSDRLLLTTQPGLTKLVLEFPRMTAEPRRIPVPEPEYAAV